MILPRRRATSRQRSFSIRPVGPIVPVSCPPWPASITMRPIFNPKARVKVDCPSRVVVGTVGDLIRSGLPEAFFADFVRKSLSLATAGCAEATSVLGAGAGLVSALIAGSEEFLIAFVVSGFFLAASSESDGGALALDAVRACGFAYKSITSREGLLSREAL